MNTKILIAVLAIGGIFTFVLVHNKTTEPVTNQQSDTADTITPTVPIDIPTHVPMYPDATLERSQDTSNETEKNVTLSLTTDDSAADVNTWYRGALNQNNWAVTKEQTVGGYILFEGENENIKVFIQTARVDNKTVITQRVRIR